MAGVAGAMFAVAVLLAVNPFSSFLDYLSFDLLTAVLPTERTSEVVLLEMDEKSYLEMKQDYTRTWSRAKHAELVTRLKTDGARGVVFDIVFVESAPAAEDAKLAQAMKAHGRVAIGMDFVVSASTGVKVAHARFPIDVLRHAAAAVGKVGVPKDKDATVRQLCDEAERFPSLPWTAAQMTGAKLPRDTADRLQTRWLRYKGPSGSSMPRLSYSDAFQQSPGFFRDKVVFIGGAPRTKLPGQEVDTFRTPYSRWNGEDTAGLEIVALNYLNLIKGDWLKLAPWPLRFCLMIFPILVISGFVFSPNLRVRWALMSGSGICLLVLPMVMAVQASVWYSWLYPLVLLAAGSAFAAAANRSAFREPAQAFSQPVSATPGAGISPAPVINHDGVTVIAPPAKPVVHDHELIKMIGRGAYGEVWLARNAIGTWHAVKIIFKDRFRDTDPFDREFRGIQKFMPISRSHPGFVNILQVGRNEAQGYFYCIMETADDAQLGREIKPETYVPRSLASDLKARQRLPLKECAAVSLQLAEAVGFLHQKGLIHRDIKPGNIIFVENQPKLADIGLVTEIAEGVNKVSYLGTRGYIAPEGPGTPGADIFSLGKVLYEASMGLDCEQYPELPTTLIERPDENAAGLIRLNQIILKACEPNSKERYQTIAELQADLVALSKMV